MSGPHLTTRLDRGVLVVTIDRPPANALDLPLVDALLAALAAAEADLEVGAVVISATGRMFVSGADIGLLRSFRKPEFADYVARIQSAMNVVERVARPVVAAVNGHAMGGGLELALACDVRFLSDAARVGVPEVKLGLLPGAGGTQRLLRAVGKGRALDLLFSGRHLTAADALAMGLVERVVPAAEVIDAAVDYAAALAAGPRAAHAAMKRAVLAGRDEGIEAGLRTEMDGSLELFATPDAAEGIQAFLDKRPARFGRH